MINYLNILTRLFKTEGADRVVLDLGSSYIKSIYVKDREIKNFFVEKNTGQPLKIFADWLKKEGLFHKSVKVGVKGQDTLIRYIPFPKVNKKNLKEVLSYEISKFIPFNKDDIYFDVSILDENYSSGEFLILLALAKKEFIDAIIKDFNKEKINLLEITVENIALINLFLDRPPQDLSTNKTRLEEQNLAIIDIGANSTLLNLVKKGMPCLSREIKISANNFLEKFAKEKDLSINDIENSIIYQKDSQEIRKIAEEVALELCEVIKNSLDYFEVNWGQRIQAIYLTGGISKITEIEKLLTESLEIETKIWNPFDNLALHFENDIVNYKNMLAVVLGSSL